MNHRKPEQGHGQFFNCTSERQTPCWLPSKHIDIITVCLANSRGKMASATAAAGINLGSASLKYKNLLIVIKQTAFEEYSQLKLRGQAPKALRWKRLEQRYQAHKACVNDLLSKLRKHDVSFSCVNRVELDRQHLADVDLMVAVGGDGTVLSAAHFLDHGTIPMLGINSDPNVSVEDRKVTKKVVDERR